MARQIADYEEFPMRTKTSMTVAGSAAALVLFGGVAYAAVQAVDTRPGPQVVVPQSDHHRSHSPKADDPATHDATDDSSGRTGGGHGADDPATHDATDDS